MNITIFGSGYVGLVAGACLAESGHHVLCVDNDPDRLVLLHQGRPPFYEPGLEHLLQCGSNSGRLDFTDDLDLAVAHGDLLFIAVGTASEDHTSTQHSAITDVATAISSRLSRPSIVVLKSTAPVGTAEQVQALIRQNLQQRDVTCACPVVVNPEFLREGSAVADFMHPDRIVLGCDDQHAVATLQALYAPLNLAPEQILVMSPRSAELTKYAANAMLATRISFINELANIAERTGADIAAVCRGIGSDSRIGPAFLQPGIGFGGSCLPKDLHALHTLASDCGYCAHLLQAVEAVNQRQQQRLFDLLYSHFAGIIKGRTFALWGLAFKPDTDDMRCAPSRVLLEALWQAGARVQAFDPAAHPSAQRLYGDRSNFILCPDAKAALHDADALLIVTDWPQFRQVDLAALRDRLRQPLIFDGRNLFEPMAMQRLGITYYAIGRSGIPAAPCVIQAAKQ